jgi:hypothetical protein
LETAICRTRDGIPFLSPEIRLSYKAKVVRCKDQIDFDRVSDRLDRSARAWLKTSIAEMNPRHVWLAAL